MLTLKQIVRNSTLLLLIFWTGFAAFYVAKPVLVNMEFNQKSELCSFADVYLGSVNGRIVDVDWDIGVNAPLIAAFPFLILGFLLDIFFLQTEPIRLGGLGVVLIAFLLIGFIDLWLYLLIGGWGPAAPASVSVIVLSIGMPIAFWQESLVLSSFNAKKKDEQEPN